MKAKCIFCQIIAGKIPAQKVYETDEVLAIKDVHPVAPVHLLIMPKKHLVSMHDLTALDSALTSKMLRVAQIVAKKSGIDQAYRLVTNHGTGAGQSVLHWHIHLLGGRRLGRMG